MAEIADSRQRQQALDYSNSFIVQAPAGSGKTSLLVKRILVLLAKGVESPEEILAITFTKKAAEEMRTRVITALNTAATESAPEEPQQQELWQLAHAALQRSQAAEWNLLANSNRLRIYTIDGLCANLTRQMPLLSSFGAQPTILEGIAAWSCYEQAAGLLLQSLEDNPSYAPALTNLLLHLDNDWPRAVKLLAAMLQKREQWLPHLFRHEKIGSLRQEVERALQNIRLQALTRCRENFPKELLTELRAISELVKDEAKLWHQVAELCLTKEGSWRKTVTAKQGFPSPVAATNKAEKERYKDNKQRMLQLLQELATREQLRDSLQMVESLPPASYSAENWQIVTSLLELLKALAARLLTLFQAKNSVDYSHVALQANAALGKIDAPTELALRLDHQLKHILVDEFQDTSVVQYQLLEKLTMGWSAEEGRTLFLVGDPMQSIYKFREAKVGLFFKAQREGINAIQLTPLTLSCNFRSEPQLIAWANKTFQAILPAEQSITVGAVPFTAVTATKTSANPKPVQFYSFASEDYGAEAAQVVEIIRHQDSNATVAVLVRYKHHLSEISAALRAANINYQAVELETLAERPLIQDLLTLTTALLEQEDRIAWLALLRAPWCGLTLAELQIVATASKQSIWEIISNELPARLNDCAQRRVQNLVTVMKAGLAKLRHVELRLLVEELWLALRGPSCVEDRSSLADAERYFALISELESANTIRDLNRLRTELAELYAQPKATTSKVQLMTIHKAKGLEFDTVILPSLQRRTRSQEERLLLWDELPTAADDYDSELVLAPIKATGTNYDPIYRYLHNLERQKAKYELQRLFYVATTRAKRELHLLWCGDKVAEGSLLGLLGTLQQPLAKAEPSGCASININAKNLFRRLPLQVYENPLGIKTLDLQIIEFEPGNSAARALRNIGIIIHEQLAALASGGVIAPNSSRVWRERLQQLGTYDDLAQHVEIIEKALSNTLNDPRGQWILSHEHSEAHCEYPLSYNEHGLVKHYLLDRTFVAANVCWIIDYKTTNNFELRPEYLEQLQKYARAMQNLTKLPIKLGLYFPLLGKWQEYE